MKKTILFTFIILSLLLAACSGASATPLVQPTQIQTTEPAEPVAAVTAEPVITEAVETTQTSSSPSSGPLAALGIDVNGQPFSGDLFLGGGEDRWLNPTLISALGGISEGSGIDASSLGENCIFTIPNRPDAVVNWEAQEGVNTLKFFFLSMGDPSLLLVTPSGKVLCNDDLNSLVLDPFLEVKDPEPGRYTAFLGSKQGEAVYPGFLVVTSQDLDPATLDLAQLFPRQVDRRGVPRLLPLDVLKTEGPEVTLPVAETLSSTNLPFSQEFTAGGEIEAFNLQQDNPLCTGFISAFPTFRFDWTGEPEQLVLFFESNVDTTLVVLGPDKKFTCNDDFQGSENINPGLSLTPEKGMYYVWVGSFSPDVQAQGTLTITNDVEAQPAVLAAKDLK